MRTATPARRRDEAGVPILDRSLQILGHLLQTPQGQSLSEIARALDFPKNTVYRILNTLCAHDYVRRDEATRLYTLSRKMATLAYDSAQDRGLLENSLDVMRRLRDVAKETVVISILDRNEGLVLEQVPSVHPFRFVCDPGTRQTIYASASTKAILAFLPDRERDAALKGVMFKRLTATTISSRAKFEKTLAAVRRVGYAVDRAEALDGVHCVAAPIFNHQGFPVAALTITGPAERIPASQFPRLGALVVAHATEISKRLGLSAKRNGRDLPFASVI
ncbi:MAG: IclR family transcriptional regulator [Verrucomicrobiae bacterium]|nr:IclR family transcriptional regulator [Verrucomicrobiae bacterium]